MPSTKAEQEQVALSQMMAMSLIRVAIAIHKMAASKADSKAVLGNHRKTQ